MAGTVNKVILVGNCGQDPEIKVLDTGKKVARISMATNRRWKDKQTGELRDKATWFQVVTSTEGLVDVIQKYVKSGSRLYVEGEIETFEFEKDGQKRFGWQVRIPPFNGQLVLLDKAEGGGRPPVGPDVSDYEQESPY